MPLSFSTYKEGLAQSDNKPELASSVRVNSKLVDNYEEKIMDIVKDLSAIEKTLLNAIQNLYI